MLTPCRLSLSLFYGGNGRGEEVSMIGKERLPITWPKWRRSAYLSILKDHKLHGGPFTQGPEHEPQLRFLETMIRWPFTLVGLFYVH